MKTIPKSIRPSSCLITGSTGFVGKNILKEILLNHYETFDSIILLIRPSKYTSSSQRGEQLLRSLHLGEEQYKTEKVKILESEITEENLKLNPNQYTELVESVSVIFHSAATVEYSHTYEHAGYININGTLNLLKLADKCMEAGSFKKFNHISTAYVTGNQRDRTVLNRTFLNTYEETKYDAEQRVLEYMRNGLPATIFRPSTIAGDSVTGEIMRTNVIFKFIKLFETENLKYLPCDEGASLNMIPIDYFIKVLFELWDLEKSIGRILNISSYKNMDIQSCVTFKCNFMNARVPIFVPSDRLDLLPENVRQNLSYVLGYVRESHQFDLSETYNLLDDKMPECPEWDTYLGKIMQYCADSGFVKIKAGKETLV